jgi:hypothetical protein
VTTGGTLATGAELLLRLLP